jgi:hypothetical protein
MNIVCIGAWSMPSARESTTTPTIPAGFVRDTAPASTSTQRKDGTPGSETRREQTFPVTVTALDSTAPSITVKGPKGRVMALAVRDPTQLQGVKVGDTVDVTYYESLLVKIGRPEKN